MTKEYQRAPEKLKVLAYRDLTVWQKAMELVAKIYRLTKKFPKDELFGLVSQLRRAAVSIPSNIAEGQARLSTGEFQQFLGHAKGSLAELETQILIARTLDYLNEEETSNLLMHSEEITRLLHGRLATLKKRKSKTK